jgi:hypothetical protein
MKIQFKSFIWLSVFTALMSGGNMTSYLKMATVQEKAMCVLWLFETKSLITMQRRYRTQYGEDPQNVIRRWLKQIQENGSDVDAFETVTPQNLANTCREIE